MHSSYSIFTYTFAASRLALYFQASLGALFSHLFGQPVLCQVPQILILHLLIDVYICNHLYLMLILFFQGCGVRTRFLLPRNVSVSWFGKIPTFYRIDSSLRFPPAGPFHLKGAGFGASTLAQCRGFGEWRAGARGGWIVEWHFWWFGRCFFVGFLLDHLKTSHSGFQRSHAKIGIILHCVTLHSKLVW